MPAYSDADVAALNRMLKELRRHPDDIHLRELIALKEWAMERWTLSDGEPEAIPAKNGEPSDADVDAAMAAKGEAVELHGEGKQEEAIAKMGEALTYNPSNAMYWGMRALYHLEFNKPRAALHDANKALELNPQNVRALRVRGTVNRHLGHWEDSLKDLSAAQAIDYDDKTNETLKYVQSRATHRHRRQLLRQHAEEEAAARRQEELRRQRQMEAEKAAAAAEAQTASGSMPGGMPRGFPGGVPGGMPGGMPPGMESVLQDPEIMAAMQDPEVAPKLAQMMQNPMAAMSMMNDPKVGPGAGGVPPHRGAADGASGSTRRDDLD
ncbi:TPR repeat family protein [Leishmania donovani]|uniref:TPR repeat family protein n=1 Tax=Leishmania donovani TaxID=5661 RepID=A0A504XU95_LEIDO|nr:TPR repeat family protein [Leishmania donovani]